MPLLLETAAPEVEVTRRSDGEPGPPARIFAVFLCGALAFLELYCTQPLLPLLARVFHASETAAGLTISASTLGVALCAALLAFFGERFDRKRLIVRAMGALALVTMGTATASNLYVLAAWRLLQGLLTPAIFIITIAYVTEEWAPKLVPRVMSVYVAGTVFGGFVGRVAGGLLADRFGWQFMFFALGIAGAAGTVLTQRILQAPKPKNFHGQQTQWDVFLENLKNRRLLATFGIGFCMLFTLVSVFSYITFYLAARPFSLSTDELSWLFTVYLFGLGATLVVGTVLARIGLRKGMLMAVGFCLTGVLITLFPSLLAVSIGLALASSGVFIAQTCANSFLRDAAPDGGRVSAAGMYICSYYVGGTVGGILPGLLWRVGGWDGCVATICALLAIAGCLAYFGWRSRSPIPDPVPI